MAALEAGPPQGEGEEIDAHFEFDAPRFYDFDEGSPPGAAAADGWFDTEGPKGLTTPIKSPTAQQPAKGAAAGAAEHGNQQQQQQAYAAGKGASSKGNPEWRRALSAITNTKGGQQQQQQPAAKAGGKRKAADRDAGAAAKPRPASAQQQQQQQQQAGGSAGRAKARPASAKSQQQAGTGGSSGAKARPASAKQRQAPAAASHHHRADQLKSSEQLEWERVEREREEAAALRRRNAAAVKSVLAPPPPPVAHSSKPLTEPVGVELFTSKRRRQHSMETRSMASPFKSMAEQIAAFEGRVAGKSALGHGGGAAGSSGAGDSHAAPGRGGKPAAAAPKAKAPAPHLHLHHGAHGSLTRPHSPRFATKARVRPARFKPQEEVELEAMAALPRFKARPVNKRMLEGRTALDLPHVGAKPPTVPEPFALKTDQRAAEHDPAAGPVFVFGAAGGEGGRVTRNRAQGAAKPGAAAGGSAWAGGITQPEPFRLATDARGAAKRPAAAEQHEEDASRPSKRARRRAPAGAFHLATDERGEVEQARLEGIRRQQEEQALAEAHFKALPLNKAALAGAWKPPPPPAASLTVPLDVHLRSDARAEERRRWDAEVAAKQAAMELERAELQALQAAAEEEAAEEAAREHRRTLYGGRR